MSNAEIIDEINVAIGAHGKWKFKLKTAISKGESDVTPEVVKCDDKCVFGKWLYGPTIPDDLREGMPYMVVRRLHGEFHQIASAVLQKALAGETDEAQNLLNGPFDVKSQILTKALTKWKRELQ